MDVAATQMERRGIQTEKGNGITTMQQLYEKIAAMNMEYYALRGMIVNTERSISKLEEQLFMWEQYQKHKAVHKQYAKVKPDKRELFEQRHHAELALYDAAERYLKNLKSGGEPLTPKKWQADISALTAKKDLGYKEVRDMREQLKAIETLKKTAVQKVFLYGGPGFHFPNKSLCVPVRANVSTRTSSSMR